MKIRSTKTLKRDPHKLNKNKSKFIYLFIFNLPIKPKTSYSCMDDEGSSFYRETINHQFITIIFFLRMGSIRSFPQFAHAQLLECNSLWTPYIRFNPFLPPFISKKKQLSHTWIVRYLQVLFEYHRCYLNKQLELVSLINRKIKIS